MTSRACVGLAVLIAALLGTVLPTAAQHGGAQQRAVLLEGLGDLHHPITTAAPQSQRFFDQGMRLLYAFNHDEALRAFRAIEDADPNCAMAQWGIAFALGPNYNLPADPERDKLAYAAVVKAVHFARHASPAEQDYIYALVQRYSPSPETADRPALDRAYATAMRDVARRHPTDLDAMTLAAEALMNLRPWDLWTRAGEPQPGTPEIVALLEQVLDKDPRHPGANHYYIHAVEASPNADRALPSALRLAELMPAAGHMVHMPAHIYLRLGRYEDAAESNRRAVAADRAYIAKAQPAGVYPAMYYPHNIHFLWSALCWQGASEAALLSADEVVAMVTPEKVREMPMLEAFLPTRLFTLARFGKWDMILATPAPPAEFAYATGVWHYARGLAFLATDKVDDAKQESQELAALHAAMPADKLAMRHPMVSLLGIALATLEGKLAAQRGDVDKSITRLQEAIALQDALQYDEPPPWYYPVRHTLGAELLAAGRAKEAAAVYEQDLAEHPENGWALFGLAAAFQAQNLPQADAARARFDRAWQKADIKLTSSEY